jgi:hypothetical protein
MLGDAFIERQSSCLHYLAGLSWAFSLDESFWSDIDVKKNGETKSIGFREIVT